MRLVVSGVGGDVSVKIPFVLMRDGPETSPISLDTCDEAYHSSRSPERSPCSPQAISNAVVAGCDVDHHHKTATEKTQDDAQKSMRDGTPIVEQVDAELHPEPKGFHSDESADPSCEDQLLPACSGSPNQLATDAKV